MIQHTVLNNKKEIYSDWLQERIINLTDSTFNIINQYEYEILQVTEKYIARPDLLSKDIYGDSMYCDILCKLNGISNPFELNAGMLLVIPSPEHINNFAITPTIDEMDTSTNNANKPIAKQRNEKRKANEALINDTRFRIDKNRGVVIY